MAGVRGRPKLPSKNCLTPRCSGKFGGDNPGCGRGLCKTCMQSASSLVRRKVTTWEELESLGLSQPKYGSLVEQALREAKKKLPPRGD